MLYKPSMDSVSTQKNRPNIFIKDKQTEKVLYVFEDSITLNDIINLFKPKEEEHIILEDENHSILRDPTVSPPRVVFVCIFVPNNRSRKRRVIVHEFSPNSLATPSAEEKPKSRHNSILI